MIIENVSEIYPSEDKDYTTVVLRTGSIPLGKSEDEESIPSIVYVPTLACIYFLDTATITVEVRGIV